MAESSHILDYCKQSQCPILLEEPMKNHTSFRIGGNAEYFLQPQTQEQLAGLMQLAEKEKIPLFFLGRGSNLLVQDNGIDGIVIHLGADFGEKIHLSNPTQIYCPAGTKLSDLCQFAAAHSLTGLEFAYGIPGSVGGAIYMNAGAYGGEVKDVLRFVDYLDKNGNFHRIPAEECEFSYRHSVFSQPLSPEDSTSNTSNPSNMEGCCILGGVFELTTGEPEKIQSTMDDILERRKSKQPLDFPSAGSTFKRPEGAFASALIDQCGLKGYRHGGAMVSEKHAGFVINYENASCQDVLALVQEVQAIVLEKTGFHLELEVKVIGKN